MTNILSNLDFSSYVVAIPFIMLIVQFTKETVLIKKFPTKQYALLVSLLYTLIVFFSQGKLNINNTLQIIFNIIVLTGSATGIHDYPDTKKAISGVFKVAEGIKTINSDISQNANDKKEQNNDDTIDIDKCVG